MEMFVAQLLSSAPAKRHCERTGVLVPLPRLGEGQPGWLAAGCLGLGHARDALQVGVEADVFVTAFGQ
jgi:hypothetical protein